MNEHDEIQLGITAAVTLIWLVSVIVCFLKWKTWTAIFGIIAPILSNIPIGGMYLHHIITEPFIYVGLPAAAIRLANPSPAGQNGSTGDQWAAIGSSCGPARNWPGLWLDSRN